MIEGIVLIVGLFWILDKALIASEATLDALFYKNAGKQFIIFGLMFWIIGLTVWSIGYLIYTIAA